MTRCPICGYEFRGGWSQCGERGHIFEQSIDVLAAGGTGPAAVSVPAGVTLERRRPARAADLRSDVVVPFMQATITGSLAMCGGGMVGIVIKSPDSLLIGVVTGLVGLGATWYLLLRQHRELLWERETLIGADLDGDGQVGKPSITRLQVTVPGDKQRGQQTKIIDLDATSEQLRTWARGMLAGRMAESDWCSGKSKLFQKPQFRGLRQEFIERGLMIWKDEGAHWQGTELTAVGRFVCRALLEQQE